MRFLQSIRWRLQIWYGLLLIAVLAGFGVAIYRMESERQFRRIDEELQRRLQALTAARHPVPNARPPRQELVLRPETAALFDQDSGDGYYYAVWLHGRAGSLRSSSAPADVTVPPGDSPARTRMRGLVREAFLSPAPDDILLVGHSVERDLADLQHLAWRLIMAGGGVVLLGLTVGAWLVHVALRPIRDISAAARKIATGDLTQRIATSPSASELGQLVQVLNSTFTRLDAAFAQQARFTADAAHELRTPVSVILAQTQYGLSNGCENDEQREVLEASQRAARRMRRLIDSLLDLARLDAGQEPPNRQPHDLATIAADCLELIRPLAAERKITIREELGPARCACDADRLAQVTTNLLINAVHYNHPEGEIQVSTSHAGDGHNATLIVRNTGPGISEEDLPRIFDRFYRADQARTASAGHHGLGLAITKAIVQSHGGTIEVTSEAGQIVTFTVSLPGGEPPDTLSS